MATPAFLQQVVYALAEFEQSEDRAQERLRGPQPPTPFAIIAVHRQDGLLYLQPKPATGHHHG